jgi:hypothetical protein
MTRAQVEEYSDHDERVILAAKAGLTVLTWPREVIEPPGGVLVEGDPDEFDVFVLRPTESWRAHAFRACRQALRRYRWSDSSEYLYSVFLGCSEASCRSWIAQGRRNRLGWEGRTVYTVMETSDLPAPEPLAFRCFPPGSATAERTVFAHPDGFLLREDLEAILPAGAFLARFALENEFFLRILGATPSAHLGVSAEELNRRPRSPVQVWCGGGWHQGMPERGS